MCDGISQQQKWILINENKKKIHYYCIGHSIDSMSLVDGLKQQKNSGGSGILTHFTIFVRISIKFPANSLPFSPYQYPEFLLLLLLLSWFTSIEIIQFHFVLTPISGMKISGKQRRKEKNKYRRNVEWEHSVQRKWRKHKKNGRTTR